jgi:hypothetical protein
VATERELGSNFAPLKMRVLDLIKLEVTQVEKGRVGTTNADFIVTLGAKQLKRFDHVQDLMQRSYLMQAKVTASLPGDCACLLSRTDSVLRFLEM